ncbi:MAG: hypothetical protein ACT4QB_16800, partial [Gammaproteobacteria bacterium]
MPNTICLQIANAARRETSVLPRRPDAIEAWAGALRQLLPGYWAAFAPSTCYPARQLLQKT